MSILKKLSLLFLSIPLLITGSASAFTPESGFWWNPDESGSGYAIEIQDNFMFVAFYVYDESGDPIWYTAGEPLVGNSFFDSELNLSLDGTCIDCAYQRPITLQGERGPVTIDFITETTGTIEFQGAVKNIERFNFILGNNTRKMLGEWQTVIDISEFTDNYPYVADVLIFRQTENIDGDLFATGCRSESTAFNTCTDFALDNNDLVAIYDPDFDEVVAVLRDTDDFNIAFYLKVGLNQFDGEAYSYPVGSEPNLNAEGFPLRGFRSASRTFVESGSGPSRQAEKTMSSKQRQGLADLIGPIKTSARSGVATQIDNVSSRSEATNQRIIKAIQKLEARLSEKQNLVKQ